MDNHNYGPSPAASVVLNLGQNVGALLIEAGPDQLGVEIEISPLPPEEHDQFPHQGHNHSHRTHSMVRERLTKPPTYDALYADLPAGTYTIWRDTHTAAATVTITGGQITRHTWTA